MALESKNSELILRILEDQEERALEDEEIIHLLLDQKLSRNIVSEHDKKSSFSNKASDVIAKFVGSWTFITLFGVGLVGWVILNALILKKSCRSLSIYSS